MTSERKRDPADECARAPRSVVAKASLRGFEYAWKPLEFPAAIEEAARLGYMCWGGQFQFRFPNGTCEMYWLESNATERLTGEAWSAFAERSAREVLAGIEQLMRSTDWKHEAERWAALEGVVPTDVDPQAFLEFVAYFENEAGDSF